MKTILKTMLAVGILAVSSQSNAQTQGINYQAVVRNASGSLMTNQSVDVIFSIIESSPTGTVLYSETQTLTTNDYAGFSTVIGQGTPTQGTFNTITWGNNTHFLNVNIDGSDLGTVEFMSVPNAFFAEEAHYAHDATDAEYADVAGELSNPIWKKKQSNGDYFTAGEPVIIGDSVSDAAVLTVSAATIANPSELVDFRVETLSVNNDILNLWTSSSSTNDAQFIECNKGGLKKFQVNVDGSIETKSSLKLAGEINRTSTGTADMIPIAYGYIDANGVVSTNTSNVSCTKVATGKYEITITGETYNISDYLAIVSAQGITPSIISSSDTNSKLTIYSFNHSGSAINAPFRFVVYKP